MPELTAEGTSFVRDLAEKHSVSDSAVEALLVAVAHGGGNQAQFNHPELGGMGQWSRGGMTMVGDMFNAGLQSKVASICEEISQHSTVGHLFGRPVPREGQTQMQGTGNLGASFLLGATSELSQWPSELGTPSSIGTQNDLRYAVFPASRRLAIAHPGGMTVYDTAEHQISGTSQQQGAGQSLTFTSQHGLVSVSDLEVVQTTAQRAKTPYVHTSPVGENADVAESSDSPGQESQASETETKPEISVARQPQASDVSVVFDALERLGALHEKGFLTDSEFTEKKQQLLARI